MKTRFGRGSEDVPDTSGEPKFASTYTGLMLGLTGSVPTCWVNPLMKGTIGLVGAPFTDQYPKTPVNPEGDASGRVAPMSHEPFRFPARSRPPVASMSSTSHCEPG